MTTTRLAAVALMCVALTGCAASGGRWNPFAQREDRESAVARKKLKNPRKLDLAYAKWQEQIGNMTEARERYQRVLHDQPQSLEAMLGLARLDQLAGRMQEAEKGYRKALKTAPNDAAVLDALGQFYATQEKWPLAIDHLKQSLQATPNDNTIRFHLAVAMAKSGDIAGAKPHFVNSVGDAEADYNLGLILHDQGKFDQAEQFFIQAAVKKPTLEQAQFWLNEIRVEKETKQLLSGTGGRPRPDLQAPAGALPASTNLQAVTVNEHRLTPNDVLGVQQTSEQSFGDPAGGGATATSGNSFSNLGHLPQNIPSTPRNTGVNNPFATGTSNGTQGLTPQQLEQLRNQR
ncbi:MAG TPA: tetratricopeptide repeat protein [Planctomycetaceae bacterium]|nr:tetratricopeptide repeat protein [Planctomycetaceae bacterium]